MPPRLAHRKSRWGCMRCKARKVKCTEERPCCAACLRHSLPCHYPQGGSALPAPPDTHPASDTSSSDDSRVVGPASPYPFANGIDTLDSEHLERRLLELRLLHHYSTVVASTLPASKTDARDIRSHSIRDLYAVDAVQVAFEYPFLLNTIFAISALHKTQSQLQPMVPSARLPTGDSVAAEVTDPVRAIAKIPAPADPEAAHYARAHRIYLNMGIQQQREALMELGPKNADAVCLTSVLLAFTVLKILPEEADPKYETPVQWLWMAHAIGAVMRASWSFVQTNSTMYKLIDPDFINRHAIFNPEYIAPFQAILDYPENPSPKEEDALTYELAASYMSAIYRAIQNGDPCNQIARRLMSTGAVLPTLFIELVEQRRPRALVILAYIMSMTKHVDDYWFFHGTAEHEVYGIRSILPTEWQWAMEWPLSMLKELAPPQYQNFER